MQINGPILNFRPECRQDSEFIARLYRSTREDLLQLDLPETVIDNLIEMQFHAQQTGYRSRFPNAVCNIVEKEGAPIGCLLTHNDNDAIRLLYIALLPQERNRGYGRCLLQALQSDAAGANKPLTLSVSTQNWQALRLYASSGFRPVSDDRVNVEMIWLCASLMDAGNVEL